MSLGNVKIGQTAFATGGQANATQIGLNQTFTEVLTCATNSDSVKLPNDPVVGNVYHIVNNGVATLAVFPPVGGSINKAALNAKLATDVAVGGTARFVVSPTPSALLATATASSYMSC